MTSLVERLRGLRPMPWDDDIVVTVEEAADTIEAMQNALKTARTYMTDFEGLPETDADNPLRQIDAALERVS